MCIYMCINVDLYEYKYKTFSKRSIKGNKDVVDHEDRNDQRDIKRTELLDREAQVQDVSLKFSFVVSFHL